MNPSTLLRPLERLTPRAPREVLARVVAHGDAMIPELINALDRIRGDIRILHEDPEYVLHIHVLHILAQFRELRAFRPVTQFFEAWAGLNDDGFGVILNAHASRILTAVSNGNMEWLSNFVVDESAEYFTRLTASHAIVVGEVWGLTPRSEVIACYRDMFRTRLSRQGHAGVWASLVSAVDDLGARELMPEVRSAFAAGLVDEEQIGLDFVERRMAEAGGVTRRKFADSHPPIHNAAAEYESWLDSRRRLQDDPEPAASVIIPLPTGVNPENN